MAGGPIIPVYVRGTARLLTFDSINPLRVSVPELLAAVAAKDPRPIGHWRELTADEYTRSFAVSKTAGYSVVREIHDALMQAFERGETSEEFVANILPFLKQRGWLSDGNKAATRMALVYDTNLRVSRATGRWDRYWATRAAFPYLRGVTARDERVRHPPRSESDHRAFDGLILPIDHSFWQRWFPPLGFRCRCSVIQMSRSDLRRWNGDITQPDELATIEQRLGEPIFGAPGSFQSQLAEVASVANEQRLPGQPALDMRDARFRGQRMLNAALIDQGLDDLASALNKILGI